MKKDNKKDISRESRPEAYPHPSQTDNQLKNQPEFLEDDVIETTGPVKDVNERNREDREIKE